MKSSLKTLCIALLALLCSETSISQTQIGQTIFGSTNGDRFGRNVCISKDGTTIAASTIENNIATGYTKVYRSNGVSWYQIGQVINGENQGDISGYSISLSADGSILAIGEPQYMGVNGRVRVFEFSNNTWIQLGQDILAEGHNDYCGSSVSLSNDGTVLAVGAYGNLGDTVSLFTGHVRIFMLEEDTWSQIGEDINAEAINDEFATSVDLNSDGSVLVVGAPLNDATGTNSGHARVFENTNGSWIQIGQDLDGEDEYNSFGYDVTISSDGSTVGVGGYGNNSDSNLFLNGHVRVYENINGNWQQKGDDIDGENNSELSGQSISMSSDGSVIVIGAPGNSFSGSNSGRTRVYKFVNGNWTKVGNHIDGVQNNDSFGWDVDIDASGENIIIGALSGGFSSQPQGSVQVFNLFPELSYLEVVEDILGNENNTGVTADQLNSIDGVSGAIEGVDYSQGLFNGDYADSNNPTALEIQTVIDLVNSTLGLSELDKLKAQIYPNPTRDLLNVELIDGNHLIKVEISNNLGQLVLSSSEPKIDTSILNAGIYHVSIESSKGIIFTKLVINK